MKLTQTEIETDTDDDKLSQMEALSKLATLGELISGVTHEVNNALNFITGTIPQLGRQLEALECLCKRYDTCQLQTQDQEEMDYLKTEIEYDELFPRLKKKRERYITGATRVQKIMKNLRSFSGAHDDDVIPIDIHQGLDSTIDLIIYDIHDRIEILKDYGPIPLVNGRPGQLNQVFMNLLINASHAIPETGVITVKTYTSNNHTCVDILDTGRGVSQQVLPHIFEPFYTTKKDGKGTGLGLSVCQDIIQKHGGRIRVSSKEGKGTTFTVELPA